MRTRIWLTGVMSALFCAWSVGVLADDPSEVPARTSAKGHECHMTHMAGRGIFESKNLTNMHVYYGRDEKLGKIDDLIIDAHTGQILYGVLDTGLFGKNIPVPWQALKFSMHENKHCYTLNKNKDELANAPTFSKTQWPNFADAQWKDSVDKFFGVQTVARAPATTEGQPGQRLTADKMILPSSRLADLNVYNKEDVKLGKVDNLVVDANAGQVLYGIVDTGIIAGRLIPVPWGAFWLGKETDRDNHWLIVDKNKDQLANAPTVDRANWPDFTSQEWRTTVDNFFGVRTAFREQPETSR